MFTNIYSLYDMHNLIKNVRSLVESSGDPELINLLEKVKCNVQDELGEGFIDEMDKIKGLSNEDLLGNYAQLYWILFVYGQVCRSDLFEVRMLENELLDRGMGKELDEKISQVKKRNHRLK